jgi:Tfp pilus assembly protein PilF
LVLGIRLQQVRQYDGALAAYKQVLQRDPVSPHAHYNIAQIYNELGQYADAQREYESALRADSQFLDARLNLGVVLYRQRQFTAAAEAFRRKEGESKMKVFRTALDTLRLILRRRFGGSTDK